MTGRGIGLLLHPRSLLAPDDISKTRWWLSCQDVLALVEVERWRPALLGSKVDVCVCQSCALQLMMMVTSHYDSLHSHNPLLQLQLPCDCALGSGSIINRGAGANVSSQLAVCRRKRSKTNTTAATTTQTEPPSPVQRQSAGSPLPRGRQRTP